MYSSQHHELSTQKVSKEQSTCWRWVRKEWRTWSNRRSVTVLPLLYIALVVLASPDSAELEERSGRAAMVIRGTNCLLGKQR